jgi:hypothetical protein
MDKNSVLLLQVMCELLPFIKKKFNSLINFNLNLFNFKLNLNFNGLKTIRK